MVRFTDTTGQTLFINPAHVRMIGENDDGHAVVYLGEVFNPIIAMEIDRVALMLRPEGAPPMPG